MVTVSRKFPVVSAFVSCEMAISLKEIRNEWLNNICKLRDIITHSDESWYVFARGNPFIFNGIPVGLDFKGIHD